MKYRVVYEDAEDGAGEVTRWLGQPMTEAAAFEVAANMRDRGGYVSIGVEQQLRPGARWMPCASPVTPGS